MGYEKGWIFWYLLLELHRSRRILAEMQAPFCVAFEKLTREATQEADTAVEEEGYGNKGDSDTLI